MDEQRTIVIGTSEASGGLLGRVIAALWLLAALGAIVLILALGVALALLLIPVIMIALFVVWLRLKLRGGEGRRNVRIRR
ncbi:MAG: hypothetical protein ACF8R7_16245 [Phycisphaerales bacterium JB039]